MIKKRVLKITALFTVLVLVYVFLSWFLVRTSSTTEMHIKSFYKEPENSMDVALIGASEMYADYCAPLAYEKYGYTGYNLCYEGAPGQLYNAMLEVYLSRQTPELVVIEVNGYLYSEEYCKREVNYRRLFDNIPLSKEKVSLLKKYVADEDRLSYYLPLIKHHSNWRTLRYQLQRAERLIKASQDGVSKTKSFSTRTTSDSVKKHYKRRKHPALNDFGRKSLEDTISFLHERGIENVLFIRAPHKGQMKKGTNEELESIIINGGYDYLDCDSISEEIIGIDKETDFYNDEHLNVFGCEKFTDFLGGYIDEHYQLKKSHTEAVDKQWQESAQYMDKAFESLKERTLVNEDDQYYEGNIDRLL